mmetsp:Transcript_14191/g.36056  ORF Transcript_14191/g.36056 Transcript_14191/m.36056 type:complete len:238 (+) Transcript_14191:491-1204(+)
MEPERDAARHDRQPRPAHLRDRVVTRRRADPLRRGQGHDHQAVPAVHQADAVEGARRGRDLGRLECGEQPDRLGRRGLQVQDLGLVWQAALRLGPLRLRRHLRCLVPERRLFSSGLVQPAAAVRPHGLVHLARDARLGEHLRHLVDERRHAARRGRRERLGLLRPAGGARARLVTLRGAPHGERQAGGLRRAHRRRGRDRLPRPRDRVLDGLRLPRGRNGRAVPGLLGEQLEHAAHL